MFRCTLPGFAVLLATAAHGQPAAPDPHVLPPAAKDILERAERMELYSLEPTQSQDKAAFGGWKVLGKTEVADAATRKRLAEVYVKGVTEYKGPAARCFIPRHGFRVTAGGKSADFVICFECAHSRVSVGGGPTQMVIHNGTAAAALDAELKKAGVPLAPGPEKK